MGTYWADATAAWADATATWSQDDTITLDPTIEWSPSTLPGETPSWEDITSYVRRGTISRGRQSEFDRTSAGRLSLVVDNRDRTFDPEANADARPNRRIRVAVGAGADTIYLFDGFIDGLPQAYNPPADATVSLTATDAFKLLARFELDEIYGPVVAADSPYAYWRLADDLPIATSATDSSGNGYDGDWKGTPSATGSLIADGPGAVSLDGSAVTGTKGDHISSDGMVASGVTLAAAPLSVEAWVKTGKYGTNVSFICGQTHVVSTTFVADFVLAMANSTGLPQFHAQVGGINVTLTGSTVLRDTGVHHLVGTVDSSRNCRLYVDGVLEAGPTAAGSTTAVDSSGSFRVGKPPVGADPGAGSSYKPFKGDVCEVAVYDSALSAARVLAHYNAGSAPWSGDSTGDRVDRVLDLIGWPSGDRNLGAGASTLGPATGVAGRSALDHLLAVEQTEQGRVFVAGNGDISFFGRNYEVSGTVEASFSDDEIADLMFDYSDANLVNDCTVTRDGGLPQRATDATSIANYWRNSETISNVMYSTDNEALAMAQWRVSNFSEPTMRPTGLTFKPYRDLTGMFHRVLGRELGDRISVTKVLAGTDVEVDAVIEGISHQFSPGNDWQTSWNLSPIITGQFGPGGGGGLTYLKLNDATLGQLNNNRLGF